MTTPWPPPTTLAGRHATLVPLAREHAPALAEAVKDGELWRFWYTSVPAPEEMAAEIERRLGLHARGSMTPFTVLDAAGTPVHGAIATAFGCPFEGEIDVASVVEIASAYRTLGITHLTLGDTTGMATPPLVFERCAALRKAVPDIELSLHFHNTRGVGLANVYAGLQAGVTTFESSVAGLGGCPFAPGATGNICTEDLVYLLHECGIETGIDLKKLRKVALHVEKVIGRKLPGQVMKAGPRLQTSALDSVATAVG